MASLALCWRKQTSPSGVGSNAAGRFKGRPIKVSFGPKQEVAALPFVTEFQAADTRGRSAPKTFVAAFDHEPPNLAPTLSGTLIGMPAVTVAYAQQKLIHTADATNRTRRCMYLPDHLFLSL